VFVAAAAENNKAIAYHELMPDDQKLLADPASVEPLQVALAWQSEARAAATQPNTNAMVLATVDARGYPTARVVLAKEIVAVPGYVTFFTNYTSAKGQALDAAPRAAIVMHWDHLHRQVRIEGLIVKCTATVSDEYFATRHWLSRLGAWASQQSQRIDSRASLQQTLDETARRFGLAAPVAAQTTDPGLTIPRPPHWGGYHLWAESVELWIEGAARIHDRLLYTRTLSRTADGYAPAAWSVTRLQP
jgi:pyridoxamine 5'-phosphate oxidase